MNDKFKWLDLFEAKDGKEEMEYIFKELHLYEEELDESD